MRWDNLVENRPMTGNSALFGGVISQDAVAPRAHVGS